MKQNKLVVGLTAAAWIGCMVITFVLAILTHEKNGILIMMLLDLLLGLLWSILITLYHKQQQQISLQMRGEIESAGFETLQQMQQPMLLMEPNGKILWCNHAFQNRFAPEKNSVGERIQNVIHLNPGSLNQNTDLLMDYNNMSYRMHTTISRQGRHNVISVQFSEITDFVRLQKENANSRTCVMILIIDGYDDVLQYAKESEKAKVSAEVERVLESFMQGTNGIIRKVENDLFYAFIESRHLHKIMENRFSVLDEARRIVVNDRIHITFSIGVGEGGTSLADNERLARQSLDMAMGRGGDQAAVKTESGFTFFGGASKGVEKKSKSRIRSTALALQELIENSDKVFLMGHRFGDLDSIGSCCGMAGAIQLMNKPVEIVVNRQNCLATNLIERMENLSNAAPKFISPEQALSELTTHSLLIICDTHNPEILESAELYQAANYVVVIDHHRKNVNFIEDSVIFHHEPYASSAAEMVTELIQYFRTETEITAAYADALLAGIMLDTKNFVMRTGVRTFEAAAYLRKIGADTVQVKTLFSDTISMYSMRAQIVAHAEIFKNFAISVVKLSDKQARVLASQAADELLSIQNVEASFVIYLDGENVGISARSMGNVNVQVVMEQLGGGGHQTMAATVIPCCTLQEAKESLLATLENLSE